jgi:hypothetical protein
MKKADQQEETPKEKHNIRDYDRASSFNFFDSSPSFPFTKKEMPISS